MKKISNFVRGFGEQAKAFVNDRSGAQMVEVLIVILIVIIVGGIVVGFVTGAVPDIMARVIARIETVFNL